LGCKNVEFGKSLIFRRNIPPQCSRSSGFLLDSFFDLVGVGHVFLQTSGFFRTARQYSPEDFIVTAEKNLKSDKKVSGFFIFFLFLFFSFFLAQL
jgi:hypothetical protein